MKNELKKLLEEISTLPEFYGIGDINVNSEGIFGNYPIHSACTWQDKRAVELLIANGADINCVGEHGETPIFRAARDDNKEFMEFLIQHGANLYVKNSMGLTPLDIVNARNL